MLSIYNAMHSKKEIKTDKLFYLILYFLFMQNGFSRDSTSAENNLNNYVILYI